jgi:hypothetical protein
MKAANIIGILSLILIIVSLPLGLLAAGASLKVAIPVTGLMYGVLGLGIAAAIE